MFREALGVIALIVGIIAFLIFYVWVGERDFSAMYEAAIQYSRCANAQDQCLGAYAEHQNGGRIYRVVDSDDEPAELIRRREISFAMMSDNGRYEDWLELNTARLVWPGEPDWAALDAKYRAEQ